MASVSIDALLKIKLSQAMQELAYKCFNEPKVELIVSEMETLKKYISEQEDEDLHFHELIQNCDLIVPEPKVAPRNPELEARIQKLKKLQEQKEYNKMTDNVDPWRRMEIEDREDKPISKQLEELNRYLLLIFQFVLSMVSAFAFGYLAPYYFYGTVDVGRRLLYGIISGFVVGMADLYFVIRHLLTTEGVIQIKEKES